MHSPRATTLLLHSVTEQSINLFALTLDLAVLAGFFSSGAGARPGRFFAFLAFSAFASACNCSGVFGSLHSRSAAALSSAVGISPRKILAFNSSTSAKCCTMGFKLPDPAAAAPPATEAPVADALAGAAFVFSLLRVSCGKS